MQRDAPASQDVLSDVLKSFRITGSLQFCFMPTGDWETDAAPTLGAMSPGAASNTTPFHIVVEGSCWLKMDGIDTVLSAGDVVAFPFATGHQLGSGRGGRRVTPVADLPPKPWPDVPVLRYGEDSHGMRAICGYLNCEAVNFKPLRDVLPTMLHVRTAQAPDADWLRATIAQMVAEVDRPRSGSRGMLERLTETIFVEVLRHYITAGGGAATGWLAALADPAIGRCLALIHADPVRDWSLETLASGAGLSRSTLAERFEAVLGTSPMRYIRDWRLNLASIALASTDKTIATIAYDVGYGSEAAFSRAFSRAYGVPPAAWRQNAAKR